MTEDEKKVVALLAMAWDAMLLLPVVHNDDVNEFRHAIHACQNIVLSRMAMREKAEDENRNVFYNALTSDSYP